jgi:hypothetical protein
MATSPPGPGAVPPGAGVVTGAPRRWLTLEGLVLLAGPLPPVMYVLRTHAPPTRRRPGTRPPGTRRWRLTGPDGTFRRSACRPAR